MTTYSAFVVSKDPVFHAEVKKESFATLEDNEVLVKISYSSVNYKDALATQEQGGVIRNYPMIPGIDLAGTVVESRSAEFVPLDEILVTGYGLGVSSPGGFSEYQIVPADWLVKRPDSLSAKESMLYGTAGFTAALAVQGLLGQNFPKNHPVLVTGASGGVGSICIALLKKKGFTNITAVSRKKDVAWLYDLGATSIVSPESLIPEKIKPLAKQTFTGIIDTVGGTLLSALLPQIHYGGAAFLCGNAAGIKIDTTVLPFILRGIKVIGIDSVNVPMPLRQTIWQLLATDWKICGSLHFQEITFSQLPETLTALQNGTHQGRSILKLDVSDK